MTVHAVSEASCQELVLNESSSFVVVWMRISIINTA